MTIFLSILKVIGIIIACIIGLILLILFLIFIPFFSYRLNVVKDKSFSIKFIVSYPLSIFKAIVSYDDDGPFITVKIFGIKVFRKDIIELIKSGSDDLEGMEAESEEDTSMSTEEMLKDLEILENKSEEEFKEEFEEALSEEESSDKKDSDDITNEGEAASSKNKLDELITKVKEFVLKVTEKWYTLKDNVEELKKRIELYIRYIKYYYKVITYKSMEPALIIVKKTIVDLLKHIKPRKIYGLINYGSERPENTAKMYGYYSLGYPFYGEKLRFVPHFDEDVFDCDVSIKGHFQIFRIVFIALRAVSNKHLRTMIRLFKGEGMKRGRK